MIMTVNVVENSSKIFDYCYEIKHGLINEANGIQSDRHDMNDYPYWLKVYTLENTLRALE